ncbi:MAG: Gfo/Idh/MocA family oxidoreductase [Rhodoferax sp.]|nr:Gfo/Idh/MocA family oxidoreductase [Actinomycetota bacterium]
MSEPVRVGVVGLGMMGGTHLRVLRSLAGVDVVAVADVVPSALVGAGPATTYDDPLMLVRDADVDAVLVASSDATHAELVLACLDRGLPVLCEKPLTTSVEDTLAILAAESARGRRLVQVGFMRRFDPAFAAVHDAVRAGTVSAPAVIHTVHRNPVSSYAFTPSVLVANSASHDVDLVRWITGDEIAVVSATVAPAPDARFASVLLRLTTSSGVLASTELTYGPGCAYDVRCEVVGRTGSVATPPDGNGVDGAWVHRFDEAYRRQDAAWVASVHGDPVGAGVMDGLANALVLAGAERSLVTGQPVTLEPPPRP